MPVSDPLNPRDPILALFNAKQEEFDNAEAAMFNAWNDKKEDIEHETSSLDFLAEQRPTINLTKSPPPFHHTRSTSIPHARGKRWKRNKRKHNHQPKHSSQDSQLYDRADLGMKSNSNNFRSLNCIRKRRLRTKRARDRRKRQREAAATSLVVRWERRDGRLQFVRKRKKNEGGEEEKARERKRERNRFKREVRRERIKAAKGAAKLLVAALTMVSPARGGENGIRRCSG